MIWENTHVPELFVIFIVLLWMCDMWDKWKLKHRCTYCGKDTGHDDSCPYKIVE